MSNNRNNRLNAITSELRDQTRTTIMNDMERNSRPRDNGNERRPFRANIEYVTLRHLADAVAKAAERIKGDAEPELDLRSSLSEAVGVLMLLANRHHKTEEGDQFPFKLIMLHNMDTKLVLMAAKQNVSAAIPLLAEHWMVEIPDYMVGDLVEMEPAWATMELDTRISWLTGFMSCMRLMYSREGKTKGELDSILSDESLFDGENDA